MFQGTNPSVHPDDEALGFLSDEVDALALGCYTALAVGIYDC